MGLVLSAMPVYLRLREVLLQVVKHTLNPVWRKFSIPVRSLCNGDYDRSIKVTCYDHESDGDHNLIGEFYVTLQQLTQGPSPSNVFQCINPEKKVGPLENKSYSLLLLLILPVITHLELMASGGCV
jgi:hypothetical protein